MTEYMPTSVVLTDHTLKSVREALCAAQTAVGQFYTSSQKDLWVATLGSLIADIDRQRPIGPDGKHGNRHTPFCQCDGTPSNNAPADHQMNEVVNVLLKWGRAEFRLTFDMESAGPDQWSAGVHAPEWADRRYYTGRGQTPSEAVQQVLNLSHRVDT
jgi:hypothetical protein